MLFGFFLLLPKLCKSNKRLMWRKNSSGSLFFCILVSRMIIKKGRKSTCKINVISLFSVSFLFILMFRYFHEKGDVYFAKSTALLIKFREIFIKILFFHLFLYKYIFLKNTFQCYIMITKGLNHNKSRKNSYFLHYLLQTSR